MSDMPWLAELIEFDDANEEHLARHGVRASEVLEVFDGDPTWAMNTKGHPGTHLMIGRTVGGRPLVLVIVFDEARRALRPVTGRTCEPHEVEKWLS